MIVRVMAATNAAAIVSAAIRAITSNEVIILFLKPKHYSLRFTRLSNFAILSFSILISFSVSECHLNCFHYFRFSGISDSLANVCNLNYLYANNKINKKLLIIIGFYIILFLYLTF